MIQFYAPLNMFKTLKPELQGAKWNTVPYNISAKLENNRVKKKKSDKIREFKSKKTRSKNVQ